MITVISGTNRAGSNTDKVASAYVQILKDLGQEVNHCKMADLPLDFISPTMYGDPTPSFKAFEKQHLVSAQKFVIVVPEYNGAFPGIFKLMIDASDLPTCWNGKKAALVGVAAGRSGNLRGLDALTNMLHYIKMDVLANKIPISGINGLLSADGGFEHDGTLGALKAQAEQFVAF